MPRRSPPRRAPGVLLGAWVAAAVFAGACAPDDPLVGPDAGGRADAGDQAAAGDTAPDWLVERAGGATTTFEVSIRSFNLSARDLGLPDRIHFAESNTAFEAHRTPAEGLGPDINATSCLSCHVDNARHGTPLVEGPLVTGPVVHVSAPGAAPDEAPRPLPGFGTRLQTAVAGPDAPPEPEAVVELAWEEVPGTYPDGTPYSLRRPILEISSARAPVPADAQISLRTPTQVAGPGPLEMVPTADILALADPDDADGDGISGRPNRVRTATGRTALGRFGWKAENPDLVHQSAGALAEDLGITSELAPVDGGGRRTGAEFDRATVELIAFYVEGLAIPAGRDVDDPDVVAGARLFESVGCTACHTPTLRTAAFDPGLVHADAGTRAGTSPIKGLADQVIHPFTDLLLHDMGPGLDDGRPVYAASGAEWRTAPLWGIGLLETVNGHRELLHDGRARSVEEAILWHGG
ncbi:MAG: hypothetical protein D6683_18320, partial [Actinomyces sp.]